MGKRLAFRITRYKKHNEIKMFKYLSSSRERITKIIWGSEGGLRVNKITGEVINWVTGKEILNCMQRSNARSKAVLKSVVMSNDWEYFLTLTFNSTAQDRYNDNEVKNHFKNFRRYMRTNYPNMHYVAVPEQHADGAIHFHLLVGGITADELGLELAVRRDKNGNVKLSKSGNIIYLTTKKGEPIYNVTKFKYGFSTATKIVSQERCASYIMKYIGKQFEGAICGKKKYWASLNCERPITDCEDIDLTDEDDKSLNARDIYDFFYGKNTDIFQTVLYSTGARDGYVIINDFDKLRKYTYIHSFPYSIFADMSYMTYKKHKNRKYDFH